jgi:hypothetical protein
MAAVLGVIRAAALIRILGIVRIPDIENVSVFPAGFVWPRELRVGQLSFVATAVVVNVRERTTVAIKEASASSLLIIKRLELSTHFPAAALEFFHHAVKATSLLHFLLGWGCFNAECRESSFVRSSMVVNMSRYLVGRPI